MQGIGVSARFSPLRVALAWGVHLLTACGALLGAAALVAAGAGRLREAAFLMLLALAIDAVDGSLARRVDVARALPQIDGRRLDDMVDYLNYTIVPAVFMVAAGSLAGWFWAGLPILASAYGFSHRQAKTPDDFFRGFPSYWNVVAVYLWALSIPVAAGTALVAVLSVAVFVPQKFVYPSRLRVLARTTNVGGALWLGLLCLAVLTPERALSLRLLQISLLYPAYYLGLSFWLGGLRRSAT